MTVTSTDHGRSAQLNALADEIYTDLANQFPICLSSDEFHFFPHYQSEQYGMGPWDDFSNDAMRSFMSLSSRWRRRLEKFRDDTPSSDSNLDIELLVRVLTTVEEQLGLVQPQKTQPSFYLTIVSIGLAESADISRDLFDLRMEALPGFLDSAISNLEGVPVIFRDLALGMVPGLLKWIPTLPATEHRCRSALVALEKFHRHLGAIETIPDFRLDGDIYARVADFHMGCQVGLEQIRRDLDEEIAAASRHLEAAAGQLCPGASWLTVFHDLPSPRVTDREMADRYGEAIARLKEHCRDNGFFSRDLIAGCDVRIRTISEHMLPVRANAAYSMPPGHPPAGGIFYILPARRQTVPRDMMLLAAHETFPGHHLLDTVRWQLDRPLRRCLEFPLFYEGWASFSEEILFDTKFFCGPVDRLLMAKRRLWRAHRGRAEVNIHTGRRRLEEAAAELADIGLVSREQAMAMVRRYALKPGYQLSYAMGRRKFKQLYQAYLARGHTPAQFVRAALGKGEMGFNELARQLGPAR
jgi:uncharacterized protein (DUF885 family)